MRRLLPLLLLLLVTACAERWERPGATEAQSDAAQARCSQFAAARVPPFMIWQQTSPGHWVSSRQVCEGRGEHRRCTTRPGYWEPPRFSRVDANTDQRRAVRANCLAAEGWSYQGLRPLRLW